MKSIQKITYFLIFFIFLSCGKKTNDSEFEKNVMAQIFPSLIDSTCIDSRIMHNFPPKYGKSIFDGEGRYLGVDSTKATRQEKDNLLKWKKRNLEIKNDTSRIFIAFDPKLHFDNENLESDFTNHFKGARIQKTNLKKRPNYIFDFGKIELQNRFKLKSISEFPEKDRIWDVEYNFNFSGVVYFSRIQFDKDKKFGILNGGFWCGHKCGQGFRIYIRKEKEKWKIDKVDGTWIS